MKHTPRAKKRGGTVKASPRAPGGHAHACWGNLEHGGRRKSHDTRSSLESPACHQPGIVIAESVMARRVMVPACG